MTLYKFTISKFLSHSSVQYRILVQGTKRSGRIPARGTFHLSVMSTYRLGEHTSYISKGLISVRDT